jgi:hypothetical protein
MRDEEIEVSMSPEVQREYDDALRAAIIKHGTLVERHPSLYGWEATWTEQEHAHRCKLASSATPEETAWSEFVDTEAGNRTSHGVSLVGVSCACGFLRGDRELRWQASVSDITEALFTVVFERLRNLEEKK